MNSTSQDASAPNLHAGAQAGAACDSAESTLRLIARLPVPEGIEDRVMVGVRAARRTGLVLRWPGLLQPTGSWMRGAAAAAIVFVVAGGGWGVYTRVKPSEPNKVVVMPRIGTGGGFSNAGAMRTPDTLNGPVVARPAPQKRAQVKPAKKALAPHRSSHSFAGGKETAQPAAPAAQ